MSLWGPSVVNLCNLDRRSILEEDPTSTSLNIGRLVAEFCLNFTD